MRPTVAATALAAFPSNAEPHARCKRFSHLVDLPSYAKNLPHVAPEPAECLRYRSGVQVRPYVDLDRLRVRVDDVRTKRTHRALTRAGFSGDHFF